MIQSVFTSVRDLVQGILRDTDACVRNSISEPNADGSVACLIKLTGR